MLILLTMTGHKKIRRQLCE